MPSDNPPTIDALLSAGASRFTVPMEPQPELSIHRDKKGMHARLAWGEHACMGYVAQGWTEAAMRTEIERAIPEWANGSQPYPPGTVLPVREEWRRVAKQSGTGMHGRETVCGLVEYRADAGNLLACKVALPMGRCPRGWSSIWWGRDMPDDGWRPAETMPDWAARRHVVVTDCRPVRVESQWCWEVSVEPKQ